MHIEYWECISNILLSPTNKRIPLQTCYMQPVLHFMAEDRGWAAIACRDSHYQLVDDIFLCKLWGSKSSPQHNCIFFQLIDIGVTNTFISGMTPCLYSVLLCSLSHQISNKSTVQSVPIDEFSIIIDTKYVLALTESPWTSSSYSLTVGHGVIVDNPVGVWKWHLSHRARISTFRAGLSRT